MFGLNNNKTEIYTILVTSDNLKIFDDKFLFIIKETQILDIELLNNYLSYDIISYDEYIKKNNDEDIKYIENDNTLDKIYNFPEILSIKNNTKYYINNTNNDEKCNILISIEEFKSLISDIKFIFIIKNNNLDLKINLNLNTNNIICYSEFKKINSIEDIENINFISDFCDDNDNIKKFRGKKQDYKLTEIFGLFYFNKKHVRQLYLIPEFGFSNRLRAILSYYAICLCLNIQFNIIWINDFHISCKLDDIYINNFNIEYYDNYESLDLSKYKKNSDSNFDFDEEKDLFLNNKNDIFIRSRSWSHFFITAQDVSTRQLFHKLILYPTIKVMINSECVSMEKWTGFHIRTGNTGNKSDDTDHFLDKVSSEINSEFRNSTNTEFFYEKIHQVLDCPYKHDVYIATDSIISLNLLKEKFDNTIGDLWFQKNAFMF